ncbi:hypothetical protein ACROYT_G000100, partial [Oculina patagonica]
MSWRGGIGDKQFDILDADPPEKQETRDRKMTEKGLEYAIEIRRRKAEKLEQKLWLVIRAVEASKLERVTHNTLRELESATQEFEVVVKELVELYSQDKYRTSKGEAILVSEKTSLKYSYDLMKLIKNSKQETDKSSDKSSVKSRNSRNTVSSRASTSSSVMRARAAAEAAAAKEQANYERMIAERENEMKQREAEEERRRQQVRAEHERDIAIMSANKRVAVANAKLKAIEDTLDEEEPRDLLELPDMDITECQERTKTWVNTSPQTQENTLPPRAPRDKYTPREGHTDEKVNPPEDTRPLKPPYAPDYGHSPKPPYTPEEGHAENGVYTPKNADTKKQLDISTPEDEHSRKPLYSFGDERTPEKGYTPTEIPTTRIDSANTQWELAPNQRTRDREKPSLAQFTPNNDLRPPGFLPPQTVFSSTPLALETFAASNQQLVANLARQSLPKCQPEVFKGDATMFHSWKRSFKAMVKDADIAPDQELNYLRSFTSGDPQELVDNYRNRQGNDPAITLYDLWTELERRFGNAAALTQALIERLCTAASFGDKDNAKLQKLADLCADVDCQINHLPGLACLNYPIAIRPIVERLPTYLRSKWEKEIVSYAAEHNDAYPTFKRFSAMIQSQSRKRNHPNVFAGVTAPISTTVNRQREETKRRLPPEAGLEAGRIFKTEMSLDSGTLPGKEATKPPRVKYCIYHDRAGHEIAECKAFANLTVGEKESWIFEERLCFRCFSPEHVASACNMRVKCSICGSERHADLLHW